MQNYLIPKDLRKKTKECFAATLSTGKHRCQAFSKAKLKRLIESDETCVDPEYWAQAQCGNPSQSWSVVCVNHGAGKIEGRRGGRPIVTGRYSKALGDLSIREDYERLVEDPTALLAMTDEISIIISRVKSLLKGDEYDPKELVDVVETLGLALQAGDMGRAIDEFNRLGEIMLANRAHWSTWTEIRKLFEQQRKIASTEIVRIEKLQKFVTSAQLHVFVTVLATSVRTVTKRVIKLFIEDEKLAERLGVELISQIDEEVQRIGNERKITEVF